MTGVMCNNAILFPNLSLYLLHRPERQNNSTIFLWRTSSAKGSLGLQLCYRVCVTMLVVRKVDKPKIKNKMTNHK